MKRDFWIPIAAAFLLLLFSCEDGKKYRTILQEAREQNLAYIPFTSDSALRQVVDYYDRHGTPNDRLLARYLLGCVYRDLHEAPIALITWEDAIACADTTAADCDYATLFRVYGQMAEVYFRQCMSEKGYSAIQRFSKYALQAGDTLNYIRGLLWCNDIFYNSGDTTAVFQNIRHVRQLYLERNLKQEAARVYPTAIAIALDYEQFDRAQVMMQLFESESGLFDEQGNIAQSYERYYYQKGRYLMAVEQVDSAKQYFRRLLSFQDLEIDGYRGLLYVFKNKGQVDSILRYNQLYEDALVRYLNNTKASAITQAEGMYDYSRQERLALQQEQKARRRGFLSIMAIVTGCVGVIIVYGYSRRKKILREKELRNAINIYLRTKEELDKAYKELRLLREHLPQQEETMKILSEKETRIQELETQIGRYKERLGHPIPPKDEDLLMHSDIVVLLRQICHIQSVKKESKIETIQPRSCSDAEWQELLNVLQRYHYSFFHLLTVEKRLPKLQFKVCILSRLHFEVGETSILLGTSMSNVSNARKRAVQRLFDSSDISLLDKLLPEL